MAAKDNTKTTKITETANKTVSQTATVPATETKPEIKTEAKAPAKATKAAKTAKETKPAKSSAAKTTASRAKKNVVETFIQFQGCEVSQEVIIERVKEQYVADGHKATEVKEVKLYIKPEDRAAYYVINDEYAGKVDLF